MSKLYGSLQNRIEEDKMYCSEIKVGTGMTEYSWSDRTAYEVTKVVDQKHVYVRRYIAEHVGEAFENSWKLISDQNAPEQLIVRRGNFWYWANTCTKETLDAADAEHRLYIALAGFDTSVIAAKGKQTKYRRAKVSFGTADYYYDYEF